MKNKNNIPLLPFENKPLWVRNLLALTPSFVLLVGYDLLPPFVKQIPIALSFFTIFFACWMAGFVPTIITFVNTLLICAFRIDDEFYKPLHNIQGVSRVLIFFSVMFLSVILMLKLRSALIQAGKAIQIRDEFLDLAAHELKTPITSLKLNLTIAEQLALDQNPEAGAKYLLESTHRQVARLERLVSSMMDLTLFDSGQLLLVKKDCDLKKIIEDLVATASGHTVNVYVCPEDCLGLWDQTRIEQIVSNILSNAMKYGNNHAVDIHLGRDKNHVWFSVKDHGAGIELEDQKRIFERFQRANNDHNVQGMGLGLYLTKTLVDLHDGDISVQSTPGAGSLFTVRLPA